ncbi:MAG: hypothetical protein NUV46_04295 [Nanoarchaeota archaeon]|nr:hypothetical protein [Nanoarchaeota archaeon]
MVKINEKDNIGVRFCQECESANVRLEVALVGIENWVCNDCGYNNMAFPIKEIDSKRLNKIKNNQ